MRLACKYFRASSNKFFGGKICWIKKWNKSIYQCRFFRALSSIFAYGLFLPCICGSILVPGFFVCLMCSLFLHKIRICSFFLFVCFLKTHSLHAYNKIIIIIMSNKFVLVRLDHIRGRTHYITHGLNITYHTILTRSNIMKPILMSTKF